MSDSPWFTLLELFVDLEGDPSVEASETTYAALRRAEAHGVSPGEMAYLVGVCAGFIQAASYVNGGAAARSESLAHVAQGWPS